MDRPVYIYGLYTDKDDTIMYVGKTVKKVKGRVNSHINSTIKKSDNNLKLSKKEKWIISEINNNNKILFNILEVTNNTLWAQRESYYISKYNNLTNSTKGGESGGNGIKKYKLSYIECEKIAHTLKFKTITEYKKYVKSLDTTKNDKLPIYADDVYENKGWIDWCTFLNIKKIIYLSYDECKKFAKLNNIKSTKDWFCLKKPDNVPKRPNKKYSEWISWHNFLDIKKESNQFRTFLNYEDSKIIIHKLNISSKNAWIKYTKDSSFPDNIPKNPDLVYDDFISWNDFLNNKNLIYKNIAKNYLTYKESKEWLKENMPIGTYTEYKNLAKVDKIPEFIPNRPNRFYSNKDRGWIDWYDFLGTEKPEWKN